MNSAGGRNTHSPFSTSRRGARPIARAGEDFAGAQNLKQSSGACDTPPLFSSHENMVNKRHGAASAKLARGLGSRVSGNLQALTFTVTLMWTSVAAAASLAVIDVIRVEAAFALAAGGCLVGMIFLLLLLAPSRGDTPNI